MIVAPNSPLPAVSTHARFVATYSFFCASFWAVTPRGSPNVPRLSDATTMPSVPRSPTRSVIFGTSRYGNRRLSYLGFLPNAIPRLHSRLHSAVKVGPNYAEWRVLARTERKRDSEKAFIS